MVKIALGIEVSFFGNHADFFTEASLVLVDRSGAHLAPVDDRCRWKRGEWSFSFRYKVPFESYFWMHDALSCFGNQQLA